MQLFQEFLMRAEYQQKALSGLPTYLKPGVSKQMKAWQRDVSSKPMIIYSFVVVVVVVGARQCNSTNLQFCMSGL